jgi:hypothetical protein
MLFLFILGPALTGGSLAQEPVTTAAKQDPFDQRIEMVELKNESIFEGIARLNQLSDIAISIEGILPAEGTTPNPKSLAKLEGRTVGETLSWFCRLDSGYTWSRDGNTANVFPSAYRDDKRYLFNRTLPELHFDEVRESDDAAIQVIHQLGAPTEDLYFLGIGGTPSFAKPWTAIFHDITVRQALNRIAQQLGPTYGWQIGGHAGSRLIMFHYKLGAGADYNVAPKDESELLHNSRYGGQADIKRRTDH